MRTIAGRISLLFGMVMFGTFWGCSENTDVLLYVNNYPVFFSSDLAYTSIAVANVQNDVEPGMYVYDLGDEIVDGIVSNGFYSVEDYTRKEFSKDWMITHLYETKSSELALFSIVSDYGDTFNTRIEKYTESTTYYLVDEFGDYIYDEDGNPVVDHIEENDIEYPVYEHTSFADLFIEVVDMDSAETIYTYTGKGSCYEESDRGEIMPSESMLWCAFDDAVSKAIYQICPTPSSINVERDDLLKMYRVDNDGNLKIETKEFLPTDKIILEFWFPDVAYYNTFAFEIVYGKKDTAIVADNIYWEGEMQRFELDASWLLDNSNGNKNFTVRLINDNRIAETWDLYIK